VRVIHSLIKVRGGHSLINVRILHSLRKVRVIRFLIKSMVEGRPAKKAHTAPPGRSLALPREASSGEEGRAPRMRVGPPSST